MKNKLNRDLSLILVMVVTLINDFLGRSQYIAYARNTTDYRRSSQGNSEKTYRYK